MSHPVSSESKKRSNAWQHYAETDSPHLARCIYCHRKISVSGGSTGNLFRHIKLKHRDVWNSVCSKETLTAVQAISEAVDRSPDLPVSAILELQCEDSSGSEKTYVDESEVQSMTYYVMEQMDVDKGEEIDKQLLRIMVKGFYPFDFIEDREFISFVSLLNLNYTLPNYKYLSNQLLSQACQSVYEELKSSLKDVSSAALTIDTWTSINSESFVAVSVYYLSKDLELKASFLDCTSLLQSSSNDIAVFLQEVAANWGLLNKIVAVVSDSSATPAIYEAIEECQWQRIPCFAHNLNILVKAAFNDIENVLTKVRFIVDYFKTDTTVMRKLLALQQDMGLENFKLKRDNSLRWNSTFDMITRILKNKSLLCANEVMEECRTELSTDDWDILEKAVAILVPFNTITIELCSEKTVPLSKLPHMVRFMLKHVNQSSEQLTLMSVVKNMVNTLKLGLTALHDFLEENDIICQSVLLDPRLKKRGFPDNYEEAYLSLQKEVVALNKEKNCESEGSFSGIHLDPSQSEYFIDMWGEFRESERPSQNLISDASVEIDAFVNEPYMNMKESPLSYWANEINQKKFPSLFELVKCRFCVPATCVPCKNIFSKEGNNLLEMKTFMTSEKIKEVLFLQEKL